MADPQLERGYTRISNELLEAICRLNISGNEMRILLFIIRRTYGFNRSYAEISLSEISNGVGMTNDHISRAIKKLCEYGLIDRRPNKGVKAQTISLVKDYEKWVPDCCNFKPLPKLATVAQNGNSSIAKNGNSSIAQNGNSSIAKNGNPTYKENIKNNIKDNFKESKMTFGKNEKVFLSSVEYNSLVKDYGREIAERYIQRMDNWLNSKNITLPDCYSELLVWLDRDNVKKNTNDGFDAEKYKVLVNNI